MRRRSREHHGRPVADLTPLEISPVTDAAGYETARALIEEYSASLGIDLCFQGLADELKRLPALYGPPSGALWLAHSGALVCGMGALRASSADTCEMKRLYVRPQARGGSVGRRLAETLIKVAAGMGYTRMRLDTLMSMHAARRLYEGLGFRPIPPYYDNPLEGVIYLELVLLPGDRAGG